MRWLLIFLVACSGSSKPIDRSAPNPELSPALAKLGWLVGDWQGDGETEHWVAAGGALFGVVLRDDSFDVMIVDDGDGFGKPDGVLRYEASANGAPPIEVKPIADTMFVRDGTALVRDDHHLTPIAGAAAPALEAADLAFAKDTAARGIDGWVAAFDPKGAMLRGGARVEGADAIHEAMAPTLAKEKIDWAPIASRSHGDLGFTVGKATFTGERNFHSVYVTIWKHQADGSWKALLDTGRIVNE